MWREAVKSLSSLMIFLASFMFQPATAATIEQKFDSIMGCDILISGEIMEGDAKELEKLISRIDNEQKIYESNKLHKQRSHKHKRVCFNSSGGSFLEALAIAEILLVKGKGSAVGKGMICESACALAFLAGSQHSSASLPSGVNKYLDRVVHPLGLLGFHSPKLVVDSGVFDKESVEFAYGLALETIYKLFELKSYLFTSGQPSQGNYIEYSYFISDRLLRDILSTKPSEFRYLQTIGDASDWGVNIAPIKFSPSTSGVISLSHVCDNVHRLGFQQKAQGVYQEPFLLGYKLNDLDIVNDNQDYINALHSNVRSVEVRFEIEGLSSHSCNVTALPIIGSFDPLGMAIMHDNDEYTHSMYIHPFLMLPPETEINSLAYPQERLNPQVSAENMLISIIEEVTRSDQ